MENKINIAGILKDCPSGMELNCLMYEDVYFDYVDELNNIRCYIQQKFNKTSIVFNQDGTPNSHIKSKCVIFPKGKNTWNGFHKPLEDGDVVVAEADNLFQLFLLKHLTYSKNDNEHDGYCYFGWDFQCNKLFEKGKWGFNRLATEKEKEKLFQAIKDNGFHWNTDTKTLEKLPIFKVGDKIVKKNGIEVPILITGVGDKYYWFTTENSTEVLPIAEQDDWELVTNKFDINTLKPFESKVLVRNCDSAYWKPAIFGFIERDKNDPFYVVGGNFFNKCIPYEGNEHLLGIRKDCDEYYKIW